MSESKRDRMTGKSRNALANIGELQDITDMKAAAILNGHVLPLLLRVKALEDAALPWWKRLLRRAK